MYIPTLEYNTILKRMPILCVDLLIIYHGKFLLLKRNNEPAKGEYWFPGGRVLKSETIKAAALRKAKAEVNLECDFQYIVSVEETIFKKNERMSTDIHTVNVVCRLTTDEIDKIKIDKLHENYVWASYDQIKGFNLHKALLNPIEIEFNKLNK